MSNAGYGQNGIFLRFARKWHPSITGKMAFLGICP